MSPRPIRRTQAISPFGVGAMVDFPGPVSLIHCGLDAWPFHEQDPEHREFRVDDEPRLAARLGVNYFVMPPDYRFAARWAAGKQPNLNLRLPFLRFPRWHVCPRCGLMFESALHDQTAPVCEGPVGFGKDKGKPHVRRKTIQVRFVAACIDGHLQDFPWREWIFRDPEPTASGRLRMQSSGSASLAGVRILCEEDGEDINVVARRTLAGAFEYDPPRPSALSGIETYCRGENPALGIPSSTQQAPGCGNHLYPLLRGGSNVYFPQVASSIYLPPSDRLADEDVLEILEDRQVWLLLATSAEAAPDGLVTPEICRVVLGRHHPDKQVAPEELAAAANRRLGGDDESRHTAIPSDTPEQAFRRQEYEVFGSDLQEGYPKTNLLIRSEGIARYGAIIRENFARVSLVHKLRETRAFVGFSRVLPQGGPDDPPNRELIAREAKEWLPAAVVRGEGIFLQLREDRVQHWLDTAGTSLRLRTHQLADVLGALSHARDLQHGPVNPRFLLLHTLSHLLINQLTYDCGYGSASLRERLYSSDGEQPMAGILIYTAAGDSEGTMGGLVRMGRRGQLETVLRRAIDRARWCSTDPVCIESTGQGPDNCNLAACHCCALLPETSCEMQNRLLDRGVVVGTLTVPSLGFFSAASEDDSAAGGAAES